MRKIVLFSIFAISLLTSCASLTRYNVTYPDLTNSEYRLRVAVNQNPDVSCYTETMRVMAEAELYWSWILLELPFLTDYVTGDAYYYRFDSNRCSIDSVGTLKPRTTAQTAPTPVFTAANVAAPVNAEPEATLSPAAEEPIVTPAISTVAASDPCDNPSFTPRQKKRCRMANSAQ